METVSPRSDATAVVREAFLTALLGAKPSPDAKVRVALNRPPREGDGRGTWTEDAVPEVESAARYLARHERDGDTYVSPAWSVGGKGAEHVVARCWLTVEVDAKSMPGGAPEERLGRARSLIGTIPCPTVTVASGHGFHAHLLLPERDRIETYVDPEDGRRHFQILGRALRLYLEDQAREVLGATVTLDHCHGPERVWRVPGGWNCKSDEAGRTLTSDTTRWKKVTLESPGRPEGLPSTAPADLLFLLPFVAAAEAEQDEADAGRDGRRESPGAGAGTPAAFDLGCLPEGLRRRWPLSTVNPSEADYAVALELARGGHPQPVAEAALRARRAAAGDPRGKAERADYVARTVRRAYAKASAEALRAGSPPRSRSRTPTPPPPRRPFPLSALPLVLRRYAVEAAACLGCCVSMVALPLLVVFGAAVGTTRRLRLRGGARPWVEPPVLWGALVAESGRLKSPALDQALDLIRRHEAEATRGNQDARRRFEQDLERYQREVARYRRSKVAGEPPERPERPPLRRHVVSDITIEALADRLADNPRGLLLARDELSAWLRSFDAYRAGGRGGDAAKWLELHSARTLTVDRKGGEQASIHLPNAAVSVIGGIQPGTLARALTPEYFENGLAARLLVTMPPPLPRRWTEAEVSDEALRAAERVLEKLLALAPRPEGDGPPILLELTPAGKVAWIRFFNEHAAEGECLDGSLAAAWSKAEGYAARFALLNHLIRQASGEPVPATSVDAAEVESGVALARWFVGEAERVYAVLGESEEDRERRNLSDWIRARGGSVTPRDLARGPRAYRGDERAAEEALEDLVRASWGAWDPAPPSTKGGRPTQKFILRPDPGSRGDGPGTSPCPSCPSPASTPAAADPTVAGAAPVRQEERERGIL